MILFILPDSKGRKHEPCGQTKDSKPAIFVINMAAGTEPIQPLEKCSVDQIKGENEEERGSHLD